MNLQQPTRKMYHAAGDVANSTSRAVPLREVSAESRRSTSPLTGVLANAAAAVAQPGRMPSTGILVHKNASSVRDPSLAPKEEIPSSFPAPTEHLATRSSTYTFSLAPSVISKASTLSSHKDKFILRPDGIEATETRRPDDANTSINETDVKEEAEYSSPSSSSTSVNEFHETDGSSSVPAYITYNTPSASKSTESVFFARRKELHFLAGLFCKDYQNWLLDDDLISDDDDSDEDQDNYHQHGCVENSGRTNFVKRNGAYRKSHEIGPLLFAIIVLDLDDDDSNSSRSST